MRDCLVQKWSFFDLKRSHHNKSLKSYDFAKAPAARKKLVPPASGLKQFFA
jgi:hypothetical protein